MGAKRAGPWAVIWRSIFASPFIIIGLGSLGAGLLKQQVGALVFGVMFAGAGIFVVWTGIREMRSAESQGKFMPGAVTSAPLGPAAFGGYRANAGPRAPTAIDVYGAQLGYLPVAPLALQPGRTLARALGRRDPYGGWALVGFSIFWNAICWPFFIGMVMAKSAVAFFLLLFVVVGVIVFIAGIKRILALKKVVTLEVDAEPAFLGDVLNVHVSQRGKVLFNSLSVALVCKEHASYRVGTDTRREEREVYRAEILDEPRFLVERGETWTRQVQVQLPGGPPSFKATNNEIAWSIQVKADIDAWPDYDEHFAIRALPKVTA